MPFVAQSPRGYGGDWPSIRVRTVSSAPSRHRRACHSIPHADIQEAGRNSPKLAQVPVTVYYRDELWLYFAKRGYIDFPANRLDRIAHPVRTIGLRFVAIKARWDVSIRLAGLKMPECPERVLLYCFYTSYANILLYYWMQQGSPLQRLIMRRTITEFYGQDKAEA
jgi:hypothetical protein